MVTMENLAGFHNWKFSIDLEGDYCTNCFTLVNPWMEAIRKGWYDPLATPPELAWDTEEHRNLTYLLDECPVSIFDPETDKLKGASHVKERTAKSQQLSLDLLFT